LTVIQLLVTQALAASTTTCRTQPRRLGNSGQRARHLAFFVAANLDDPVEKFVSEVGG
jgi:hypothetical protein